MPSSIPLAKATLLSLLQARAGLAGVQCEWSHPGDKMARESMFFDTTEMTEVSGQLGNGTRHESYTLHLWIVVHRSGDDGKATEERCWELAAEIEAQLSPPNRADLGLGPPDVKSIVAEFAGAEQDNFIEDEGRTAQVKVSVGVEARI